MKKTLSLSKQKITIRKQYNSVLKKRAATEIIDHFRTISNRYQFYKNLTFIFGVYMIFGFAGFFGCLVVYLKSF